MDEHGRATVTKETGMTKKTSKARESKRAFSEAVRGLRKRVADKELAPQDAVRERVRLAKEHGVKVAT